MEKGIFITATGTDIGKTYVSALLVKLLREKNINCGYFKPVLSGAEEKNDEIIAGDVEHVLKTAQISGKSTDFVSYIFKPAISPHLAAEMNNQTISLNKILDDYKFHENANEFTVVEGAGGIICPLDLNAKIFMYDLIKNLNLGVIVVANAGLGTINTTFLTVDFLKRQHIIVKGIILNNYDSKNPIHENNKAVIEKICEIKVLGTVAAKATNIDFKENILEVIYDKP